MGDSEIQKRCKDSHSSDKSSELETTFDKESTAAKNTHDASVTDKSVVVTDTEVSQTFPKRNQDPKFITNGCNETLKNEDADEKDRCSITKCEVDTLFEHGDSEELRVTKDNLDDIIDAEVAAFNLSSPKSDSPPIQVHEVTSTYTKEIERNTSEISETIAPQLSIDIKDVSPTRFAQNVQKLVEHTLKKTKHDIVEIDPSVKMTIDAQLLKLSEKKPIIVNEQKNHISPLPLELHYSRPSTPVNRERQYKLLPKDIIFCSGLIDSHGGNYSAMVTDPRNIYKETARGLQRKIRIFKESPHFQTYLRAKEEGKTVEEILRLEDN
uniref:Nucleolar protein 16 n=1 Tax=Heterorhabditis bacteriophora TaxID=37862 RepID=A0A1I7XBB8_HETBA